MAYFYERRGMTICDKSVLDNTERDEPMQIKVKTYPFNHEAFYEARRNEIAIAAGKAYENITKAKIMHEQTSLRHTYYLYLEGKRSEAGFKEYAEEAIKITTALMEEDRAAFVA